MSELAMKIQPGCRVQRQRFCKTHRCFASKRLRPVSLQLNATEQLMVQVKQYVQAQKKNKKKSKW